LSTAIQILSAPVAGFDAALATRVQGARVGDLGALLDVLAREARARRAEERGRAEAQHKMDQAGKRWGEARREGGKKNRRARALAGPAGKKAPANAQSAA
jgi:hypothetical protein